MVSKFGIICKRNYNQINQAPEHLHGPTIDYTSCNFCTAMIKTHFKIIIHY